MEKDPKYREKYINEPLYIPNEELLVSTIVFHLTDILLSDKKEHNIYTNVVVSYMMATGEYDEEEYNKK